MGVVTPAAHGRGTGGATAGPANPTAHPQPSRRGTAETLRRDGLDATTAVMRASSPRWLADELARSWRRQWPRLPDAMDEAAAYPAPTAEDLRRLDVPLAVVAASDDAVHPAQVAADWVSWAPRAALRTVRLEEFGPDPELLGRACIDALRAIDGAGPIRRISRRCWCWCCAAVA